MQLRVNTNGGPAADLIRRAVVVTVDEHADAVDSVHHTRELHHLRWLQGMISVAIVVYDRICSMCWRRSTLRLGEVQESPLYTSVGGGAWGAV